MRLNLHSVDPGFCRVYYRNEAGNLYCFQLSWDKNFDLFVCTREGEPSHVVSLAARTLDNLPAADCSLTTAFSAWVAGKELELCLLP